MASNARPHGGNDSQERPKQPQAIATAQIALRNSIMDQVKELGSIARDIQAAVKSDENSHNGLGCIKRWHHDERGPIRDYYNKKREDAYERFYQINALVQDRTRSYDEITQSLAELIDEVGCWLLQLLKMVEIAQHHVNAAPGEDGTGGGTIRQLLLLEALKEIAG
jgi:hypothetical protein